MQFARIQSRWTLIVLISTLQLILTAAAVTSSAYLPHPEVNLSGVIARQLVRLTAPGHDPRHPVGASIAWAVALDRTVGASWLMAPSPHLPHGFPRFWHACATIAVTHSFSAVCW